MRGLAQLPRQIGGDGEFEPELARGEQAVAHAGEIPRAAASEAEAGEGARQIGRALEDAPQPVAQVVVLDERRDGILPVADAVRMGEGAGEPLGEEPRAARRHRAIDGGEQAACPLAGQGPGEFQVGAGRRIDGKRRAGGVAGGRVERRTAVDLRLLDVEERAAGRCDLGRAEGAEGVEGRDPEITF